MRKHLVWLVTVCLVASFAATSLAQGMRGRRGKRERPNRGRGPEPLPDVGAEIASHKELKPLGIKFQSITALRMHTDGNLLATDKTAKTIKVIAPDGKLVRSIKLPFGPEAINVAEDGTMYCGGEGQLAKLTKEGKVIKKTNVPANVGTSVSATSRRRARSRPVRISGIAASGRDLFVAFGSGWSTGSKSKLFRFNLDLGSPKMLADGLRGCCQRCDIAFHDGILYLAENAVHRVVRYDREGKILGKWGTRARTDLKGFGSCCNPMNLCFDADGVLYAAESGLGRVKRYATDGKFLGLVGYVGVERFSRAGGLAASCSNIAIAVTPDGSRVYVMDFKRSLVRVLEKKG